MDFWLYPWDLQGIPYVINVFQDIAIKEVGATVYRVPDNWKDIVTNDNGIDEKPSIHDIMEGV